MAGRTGQFSPAMLGKVVAKELQPIYYVAGPPGMVTGVQAMLKSTDVTNEDVRSEKFGGY